MIGVGVTMGAGELDDQSAQTLLLETTGAGGVTTGTGALEVDQTCHDDATGVVLITGITDELVHSAQLSDEVVGTIGTTEELVHSAQVSDVVVGTTGTTEELVHSAQVSEDVVTTGTTEELGTHSDQVD